jgi:NDP-mannose synthase
MIAVIQAGGKGTRLRPYTLVVPKPIMPLGEQPVIEVLLKWLRRWSVMKVYITVGYLGHLIRALCGDGHQWDMEIIYSEEQEPLGTIGPLRLIEDQLTETFLVLNGDLITDMNLGAFIDSHRQHNGNNGNNGERNSSNGKALVTVAVTEKFITIDLGVLGSQNSLLTEFREKPKLNFQVSMGIYCMEPAVLDFIPHNVPFGFDDLMYVMLARGLPVHLYKHEGLWMDIGRTEDFCRAQEAFSANINPLF